MDNGENPLQRPQQSDERKGIIDRANNAVSNARRLRARAQSIKNASRNIRRLRTAMTVVRTGAMAANPWFWVILIIVIIILLLIFILLGDDADYDSYFTTQPTPSPVSGDGTPSNVTLQKSGPEAIGNGENITYTINVSYSGTGNVMVYDPIPANTEFVSASGNYTAEKDSSGKVTRVKWSLNDNLTIVGPTVPPAQTTQIDVTKYTQAPYNLPVPNGESDIAFAPETIERANRLGSLVNQYQNYILSKVHNNDPKYADPFLSVIWTVAIEGSAANPYAWNCRDMKDININMGCAGGFYSGGWQVGGVQVAQVSDHLVDDFIAVYGSGDAATVQRVGQKVIDEGGITNPVTFPAKSIEQIVQEAGSPGTPDGSPQQAQARQLIAILLMDPAINAIANSLEIAGDIAARDNWSATMQGWGSWYRENMQRFSNRMSALAQVYTGSSSTSSPQTVNQTFLLTVKPTQNDIYVDNQATAEEVGGSASPISSGEETPANAETCDGYYTGDYALNNPYYDDDTGANFGDPACTLLAARRPSDKSKLYTLLKELDPQYADEWFNNIIPCESGFNPNAYASQESIGTPDPAGAWGLYQMGRGRANEFDHGDVDWRKQTSNAINYNKLLFEPGNAGPFEYWACADHLWGTIPE